jgi:hypothetical protein
MIALPTVFEVKFVEVWQSSQTCRFFITHIRSCVDEAQCNSQFLAMVTQMNLPYNEAQI